MSYFSCKYTYQQACWLSGHQNEEYTQATAKHLNSDVKGLQQVKFKGGVLSEPSKRI